MSALFVDLADRHQNTSDGVHVASTGGVWSSLVAGFGGFRDHGGVFSIDPRLPETWDSLAYRVTLLGTRVKVTVRADELELEIEDGQAGDTARTRRGRDSPSWRPGHSPAQGPRSTAER